MQQKGKTMKERTINLALQGGGAHGAFTWGVLERLLDEPWLTFEGISGTSAGAMNAVMLAEGWRQDGRKGAQALLEKFWLEVSTKDTGFEMPGEIEHTITKWWLNTFQHLSPYDVNILNINPLREIVDDLVDFSTLRENSNFKLFIAATKVNSGQLSIFRESELSTDHVLASACLPKIHHAIEIENEFYWDGGFSGNPAVFPLIYDCQIDDTLVILLQPLITKKLPKKADEIKERTTEMSFHSTFLREMMAITQFKQLLTKPSLFMSKPEKSIYKFKTHLIENHELMSSLASTSKYNNRKSFLNGLREKGQKSGDDWLANNAKSIAKKATYDIFSVFA